LFALALNPDNVDLGGGCRLYAKDPLVFLIGLTDGSGFADSPAIGIPLDISLRGNAYHAQAIILDAQGPVSGLAFSAGRKLVLGD
jgi:hypothetical protein